MDKMNHVEPKKFNNGEYQHQIDYHNKICRRHVQWKHAIDISQMMWQLQLIYIS